MNRPFYAFGLLLALLALAMVAVSSTSRTTTVQAPRGEEGSLLSPAASHGTIYIVVLPAAEETIAPAALAAPKLQPCVVALVGPKVSPVVVNCAEFDAACGNPSDVDCLSHYDRGYDEAVYPAAVCVAPASSVIGGPPSDADEIIATFRSLARPSGGALQPAHQPPKSERLGKSLTARLGAWIWKPDQLIWRGVQSWVLRPVEPWMTSHGSSRAPDWTDYSNLMNAIRSEQPASSLDSAQVAADESVRSSGWLLHFAVSSLSRAGLTLQRAAAELERLEISQKSPDREQSFDSMSE